MLIINKPKVVGIGGNDNLTVDVHPISAYSNNLLSFPRHRIYI